MRVFQEIPLPSVFVHIWAGESPPPCCLPAERRGWVPLGWRPPEAPYGSSPRRGNLDRPGPVPIHKPHIRQDPKPQNLPAYLWGWWLINAQRLIGGCPLWEVPHFTSCWLDRRNCPKWALKGIILFMKIEKKMFSFFTMIFIWKVKKDRVRWESCQDTNHETATLSP